MGLGLFNKGLELTTRCPTGACASISQT